MKSENIKGEHIDIAATISTSKTDIYTVPTGYTLQIEEIAVQKDSNAGTITLTDEGKYKDGATTYTKTVHSQHFAASGFDDTKDFNVRTFATLKGITDAGNATIIIKGSLI